MSQLRARNCDYIAVNGFANRYWRWGLEDNDMYHRIYTVFHNLVRLPQEIGNYSAHVRLGAFLRPWRECSHVQLL